jgi:hypothetical protein
MYERRSMPLLPRAAFLRRLAAHSGIASLIVGGSLLVGMIGYRYLEGLTWLDAFVNAAMLLGGEGPLKAPASDGGKLFAGFYALYSGLVFIAAAGIMLAPVGHRLLHRFHWEDDASDQPSS